MHKLMIMQYLNRILDEAERTITEEKNRIHWRKATSEDYFRIAQAYADYERLLAVSRDIFNIFSLYP